MNQQAVLAALKKWGFWVICGLAVLIGLIAWFVAQQSVQASIKARKDQLEGLKTQVSGVKPSSPNPQVIEAARKQIDQLKADVYQAWVTMYADQKEKNKWPSALGAEFLNWVNQPGRKPGDPIPERFREIYLNFIEQHFPTLFEIVNLRRPANVDLKQLGSIRAALGAGGYGAGGYPGITSPTGEEAYGGFTGYSAPTYPGTGMKGAGPTTVEMVGVVEWNPQNITAIKQRFAWRQVPTSDEIWNAQEDLWVYEALLRIIAKTNEGATGPHNAAVKRITAIEIGPDAAKYFVGTRMASTSISATSSMGAMGSPGMEPSMTGEGESEYGGYGSGYGMSQYGGRSMYGRYVDASGSPLPPGSAQPFAEFKMMPVCLNLVADQRKIDQLLVNCANSDMPVRITRVLIRPGQASRGTMPYGGPGATTEIGESASYGYESEMGASYGYRGTGGTPGIGGATPTTSSHDVPIVIEGVIYLFNPPNIEELGKEGAPELVSGQSLAPIEAAAASPEGEPAGAAGPSQPAESMPAEGQPMGVGAPGPQPVPATGLRPPQQPGQPPLAVPPQGGPKGPTGGPPVPAATGPVGPAAPPPGPPGGQPTQPGPGNL
ncbi:MAG: hypothetical protein ACUVQH_13640 [Thermogutta sp.]